MENKGVNSTRTRQARWDAGHLRTASTRLPTNEYLRFKMRCMVEETTPYALLKGFIREWMQAHER